MPAPEPPPLLVVGNPEETHVGAHFRRAADALSLGCTLLDSRAAFDVPAWRQKFDWHVRGRRPSRLRAFGQSVRRTLADAPPQLLVATGIAPLDRLTLEAARRQGCVTVNFLTDDPWNPAHQAKWFLDALPAYDHVFSPRTANLADLRALVPAPAVQYLPFAYTPEVHYPESARTPADRARYEADVMFAGNADADRCAIVSRFIEAGLTVALYGDYWDRSPKTRVAARGHLGAAELRKATGAARICLCLVRRANRDGHAMRSYEVPAMGGCVLAEDTEDHRRLFGSEGDAALYFRDTEEAVAKARDLLRDEARRAQLATRAHAVVTAGRNRYLDRLRELLLVSLHVAA